MVHQICNPVRHEGALQNGDTTSQSLNLVAKNMRVVSLTPIPADGILVYRAAHKHSKRSYQGAFVFNQ